MTTKNAALTFLNACFVEMGEGPKVGAARTAGRVVLLLVALYFFLVSIELLGASFKLLGRGFAEGLLRTTSNPLIGLFLGVLATSVVQSSSATTSIVVSMVAAGTLTIRNAVPIIMGANIGTTVTNTVVSLGHITRPVEFRRAFAGATVHDFFNLLAVVVFLPLEIATHYLEHAATFLQKVFAGVGGVKLVSPLKLFVKPCVHLVVRAVESIGLGHVAVALTCLALALITLFFTLSRIVRLMKLIVIGKFERLLHGYLFANPLRSFVLGLVFTAVVQSSSVVTSLVVPIVGAGILSVEQIFPYTLGANVGTTVTAIMASFVTQNPAAMAAAFVHLLFNISGIVVWYPLRTVPIELAKKLGEFAIRRRWLAISYIGVVFYVVPLLLAWVFRKGGG